MANPASILLTAHGEPINVGVRYSARSKQTSIRVSHKGVELVVPVRGSVKKAHEFLLSREYWVRGKLKATSIPEPSTTHIPIYGQLHEIVIKQGIIPRIEDGKVFAQSHVALGILLKAVIRLNLQQCVSQLSKQLGVTYNKISIRDTKGQWGSCSHSGNLSFSWRLIFAPKHVMEYLVAHELSHLIEKNHSPKFWNLVKTLHSDYESAKKWLKHNGTGLHRYFANDNLKN